MDILKNLLNKKPPQIQEIPLDVLFNLILVQENVRPAMLFQSVDYSEKNHNMPKSKKMLAAIKYYFPDLLFTFNYTPYQGVIISKMKYDNMTIDNEQMGKILGYPCANDLRYNDSERLYIIDILVVIDMKTIFKKNEMNENEWNTSLNTYKLLKEDPSFNFYKIDITHDKIISIYSSELQLLANGCIDSSNNQKFEQIAERAENVLKSPETTELLQKYSSDESIGEEGIEKSISINKVNVLVTKKISDIEVINHLINNKLNQQDIDHIKTVLYNNTDLGLLTELNYSIDYSNPLHKGIIIMLLLEFNYKKLDVFSYKDNPSEFKKVREIENKLMENVINILSESKNLKGSGKKTMRQYKRKKSKTQKRNN